MKGSTHQEDLTSIYASNLRAPKLTRKSLKELMGEIHSNKVILRDFNTSLSIMNRTIRTIKRIEELNKHYRPLDLTEIYKTFYPKTAEYTFLKYTCNILQDITHKATKQVLTNSRKLNSHRLSFPITIK